MKRITLLAILLVSLISNAQETDSLFTITRKHEVKIGAVKLLAGPILEGTYEYIHRDNFTFGASVLYSFIDKDDYPETFSVTPFARLYFGKPEGYGAKGFFVEGFAKYVHGNRSHDGYDYILSELREETIQYNTGAIGLALGGKWINKSGFVFELLLGAGRTFGSGNDAPEAVFRGDFNLGYRF